MKFNLNHDPNNKTLAIPRAALQLSGLAGVSDLILHTDSGCILLLPGDPTVAELLKTISLISAVTPQLISRLAERSQMAMEAGMTETACGACEHEPHCSGLEIPPCQLAEAGISPTAALESFVEEGRVIVQAAEKTAADVLIDELDDDVRKSGELQSGAGNGKSFIVRIMVQIEFHAVFLLGGCFGIWTSFSSHSPRGSSKRFSWWVM